MTLEQIDAVCSLGAFLIILIAGLVVLSRWWKIADIGRKAVAYWCRVISGNDKYCRGVRE